MTKNQLSPKFSPQQIIDCNFYTEGCDGGYEILVAKFAWEFGLEEENCYSPNGDHDYSDPESDGQCFDRKDNCGEYSSERERWENKYGVSQFNFVGGKYGESSELSMMKEIRARGPIPVAFNVNSDFYIYQNGVFKNNDLKVDGENVEVNHFFAAVHTDVVEKVKISNNHMKDSFEFEDINHSVLILGWGQTADESPKKYWIVQNSWGYEFGEDGYFYILRGEDNAAIESFATDIRPRLPRKYR